MFYRDLIFAGTRDDVAHCRELLLIKFHETFNWHGCAVAFPRWTDGRENRSDTFDTFTRYADPGKVLRLFADTAEQLENAFATLGLHELVRADHLTVTPVQPVPQVSRAVAVCRSRDADRHARITNRFELDLDERYRREEAVRSHLHQQAYIKMISSKGQQFSLSIERRFSDTPSAQIDVTSYGLSRVSAPCFLPDF